MEILYAVALRALGLRVGLRPPCCSTRGALRCARPSPMMWWWAGAMDGVRACWRVTRAPSASPSLGEVRSLRSRASLSCLRHFYECLTFAETTRQPTPCHPVIIRSLTCHDPLPMASKFCHFGDYSYLCGSLGKRPTRVAPINIKILIPWQKVSTLTASLVAVAVG